MTMQVGMVGRDGIVLAGDTLESGSPHPDLQPQHLATWMGHTTSKIKVSSGSRIAVSCSGELRNAYPLADEIINNLNTDSCESPEARIQEIAFSFMNTRPRWYATQSLILLPSPPSLYRLNCLSSLEGEPLSPQCERVPLYNFAGDALNPAIYWAIRYCRALPHEMLTLRKLTRLAVHIVVEGGIINSGPIGGLEVVYCTISGGIKKLDDDENYSLFQESLQLSDQVRLLLGAD